MEIEPFGAEFGRIHPLNPQVLFFIRHGLANTILFRCEPIIFPLYSMLRKIRFSFLAQFLDTLRGKVIFDHIVHVRTQRFAVVFDGLGLISPALGPECQGDMAG